MVRVAMVFANVELLHELGKVRLVNADTFIYVHQKTYLSERAP